MYGAYIGKDRLLVEGKVGSKIIVPSSNIKAVSELMCNGMYKELLTFFLIKALKEGNKVLELGAGFGYFSVLCSALVGKNGQVVSVEENENNIEIFNENLLINNIKNKVILLDKHIKFNSEFISEFDYVIISKEYSNTFILDEIKNSFMKNGNTKFVFEIYDNNVKNTYIEFINDICSEQQCKVNLIGESNELKAININNLKNINIESSIYISIEFEGDIAIHKILEDIDNGNNIEENIEMLNRIYFDKLEAINLNNDDIEILNRVAIYNYEKGNYNYVIPYLNAAYKLDDENTYTLYNLASVLYNLGEFELALKYINKIQVQNRNDEIIAFMDEIKAKTV